MNSGRDRQRLSRTLPLVSSCLALVAGVVCGCGDSPPAATSSSWPPQSDQARPTPPAETGSNDGDSLDIENSTSHGRVTGPARDKQVPVLRHSAAPLDRDDSSPTAPVRYRNPDRRPEHNDRRLIEFGIRRFESARLRLYTDLDPRVAETLPAFVDELYEQLVRYFGPLPPDRFGTEFQLTGYIMIDKPVFEQLGLLPEALPDFPHGRHFGYRFWMNNQQHDYYRRHLMLHEAVHCFMTAAASGDSLLPVWYLEGMAELFATHRVDEDGRIQFRVMPHNKEDFKGLGRISLLGRLNRTGDSMSIDELLSVSAADFIQLRHYAHAWAFCHLLSHHPVYNTAFRELGTHTDHEGFTEAFDQFVSPVADQLNAEWNVFCAELVDGYDVARNAIEFKGGMSLAPGSSVTVNVAAGRGWQSSGLLLDRGTRYRIQATGRVRLAETTKPWISEPPGITFRYNGGRPLGQLHAAIYSAEHDRCFHDAQIAALGSVFNAQRTGTLYLRINDAPSERSDNSGHYVVSVARDE